MCLMMSQALAGRRGKGRLAEKCQGNTYEMSVGVFMLVCLCAGVRRELKVRGGDDITWREEKGEKELSSASKRCCMPAPLWASLPLSYQ